jgi:cold shock protein
VASDRDDSMAPLFSGSAVDYAPPEPQLMLATGRVKWFDLTRGFGFMIDDAGGGDILIHFSVLREHDRRSLPEGTRLKCEVVARDRGLQAKRILTLDLSSAIGPDPDQIAQRSADRVDPLALAEAASAAEPVRIKWFNRLKGYGFVVRPDQDGDIFVHMETLRRAGIIEIEPDMPLKARIADGRKGPLAVVIERI